MGYRGRMVVDLSAGKNHAAGYVLEVRSWDNKKRKIYNQGDRMYVGPLVPGSESEIPNANLIFYNTMFTGGNRLIITNGQQTDSRTYPKGLEIGSVRVDKPSFEDSFSLQDAIGSAERIMSDWQYESDPSNTPRIALVKINGMSTFAIAAKHPEDERSVSAAIKVQVANGKGLSTYTGLSDSADSWRIRNSGELERCLTNMNIEGYESAKDVADVLYEFADPNHVVLAAGAVLDNGIWKVAHRNRYETEDDWARDREEREAKK